jgi:NAD(P)-dependent dehydrogenase (short-subunit alcohol dehydrogenase family)
MKRAIVTGAGRGIGLAIAQRLAAEGWVVGVLDTNEADVNNTVATIPHSIALVADISQPDSVAGALETFGEAPHCLVNNAGIVRFGPLLTLSHSDFSAVVNVNLVGTFNMARAVAQKMIDANIQGTIINVTSMNGVAPGPNAGAYGATKSGIALMTQQMAIEWGPLGIRVNAIAPGLILAGMSDPIYADPVVREARESRVPLGRLGTAEDIANTVVFLSSDQSSYMTGQNLLIDGGVTMSVISSLPRPASVDSVGIKDSQKK